MNAVKLVKVVVPPGSHLDARAVLLSEVGDECQVRRLHRGPAELEDDDEQRVVDEFGPDGGRRVARQTRYEDEGSRQRHQHSACEGYVRW